MILTGLLHIYWAEWPEKFQEKWENDLLYSSSPESKTVFHKEQNKQFEPRREDETESREETEIGNATLQLGMTEQELVALLGQPVRIDATPYDYSWWIFEQDWTDYIQVGVRDGVVNTYYTNSPSWGWGELFPGMSKVTWTENFLIKPEVSFRHPLGLFTFTLSKEEQRERPLMIDGDTVVQLYIDLHNGETISGIRVMDVLTILLQKPYTLKYIGELPETPLVTEEDWQEIAKANEQQVFTLVNIVRRQHGLHPLAWDEHVAYVAREHSADMLNHNFFDHYSPIYGDLGARLKRQQVSFMSAGENIAWNYVDAPDAHEGWLNSPGHRQNIFKEEFTHLGVGVVEKYYTQNFITYYPATMTY